MIKALNIFSVIVLLFVLFCFQSLDPLSKAALLLIHLLLPLIILIFWRKYDVPFERPNLGPKKVVPNDPSFGFFLSSFSMFIYWLRAKPITLYPGKIPNPFETSEFFILYGVIVTIVYFSIFFWLAKKRLRKKSIISWAFVCGFPYILGSAYGINEWFDVSSAMTIEGNIIKKTKYGTKYKEYSLNFQKNETGEVREYSIRSIDFDRIGENGRAVIKVKPGLLNVPWLAGVESN